jgi:TP901 family phage tail tape measure protein
MATLNRLVTVFSANTTSFTTATKRMQRNMVAFKASVLGAGKAVNSAFNRMALAAGVSAGLMIKHYAEFEKRMASVGAILKKTGGVYGEEMKSLVGLAKRMGRTTIFTATQAAEAQQVMAMAGLSQKEILTALGPALQLAAVGEVEIAEAAEIAAKTMRGMNLSAGDLYRVNNVLAGALTTSTTNMTQLGNALKYVAPLAAATNTSIENTVAMIGKLSSAGFQGEMAGTGLRQAMAKLAGSTPHATKVLGDFGIQTIDAAGDMLPMFDILHQMEQQALSAGQVFEIFGARAGPQMLALLAVGVEGLEEYSLELEAADRNMLAARIEQDKLNTIWGAWRLMISAVSGVVIDASADIAMAIRRAQARFVEFFDNLDRRAAVIHGLSAFMGSFIGMLENLLVWINANSEGLFEFASAMGTVIGGFFNFLAQHPQVMAALIALKIGGLLGVTGAVTALGRAVWHLVIMVWPRFIAMMAAVKLEATMLSTMVGGVGTAMKVLGLSAFAVMAAFAPLLLQIRKLNKEYERGVRALEKLHKIQMKGVDVDIKKATEIKDASDQMDAFGAIQQKLGRSTETATKRIEMQEIALQKLIAQKKEFEDRVGPVGAPIVAYVHDPKIAAARKELENQKAHLEAIERRKEEVDDLFLQAEARVQGVDPAGAGAGGGAGGGMPGMPGMGGMGGGGGGGGGGSLGDVDKAIADRIEAGRRTEEREKFGRPAAREGAELEKFLDMGPAKDELLDFMATLDGLTASEAAMLADVRSLLVESAHVHGMSQAEIDEEFRQQAMIRLQRHHQEIKDAEEIKALQEVQKKAGSLEERLAADPMSAAGGGGVMEPALVAYNRLKGLLDTGAISAQQYSEQLSRVSTSYQTGASVAKQLEKVQYTQAESADIASGVMKSYSEQFKKLQLDFRAGGLNTSEYKFAIQALSQAMRDSTRAAKEEEAAEKAAAAARRRKMAALNKPRRGGGGGGGGGGGPTGPAHPMDVLLRNLAMAQSRMSALNMRGLKYSRDVKAFRQRRASFARAQMDVAMIQNAIANLRMRMLAGPMMAMQANRGAFSRMGGDPGMVTQGNITVELPNIRAINQEDIETIVERIDDERSRQGRRVV